MPGRLALVNGDNGTWLDRMVDLEKRDAARLAKEAGAAMFAGCGSNETGAAEGEEEPPDNDWVGIDAYGQRSGNRFSPPQKRGPS